MRKISFAHIRQNHLHGGVTLAYQTTEDDKIEVAFSFCSNTERYIKRVGREISKNRLQAGRKVVLNSVDIPVKHETRSSDLIDFVITNLDTYKAQLTKPYKAKN